jgi:hypothetical protein
MHVYVVILFVFCFRCLGDSGSRMLSLSIAASYNTVSSAGGFTNARSNIYSYMSIANNVYRQSFNVYFRLVDLYIYTSNDASTPNWNQRCTPSPDNDMIDIWNEFGVWVGSNKNALWYVSN